MDYLHPVVSECKNVYCVNADLCWPVLTQGQAWGDKGQCVDWLQIHSLEDGRGHAGFTHTSADVIITVIISLETMCLWSQWDFRTTDSVTESTGRLKTKDTKDSNINNITLIWVKHCIDVRWISLGVDFYETTPIKHLNKHPKYAKTV